MVEPRPLSILLVAMVSLLGSVALRTQTNSASEEIPIERCDVLPVVILHIDSSDMRFLLDTGATTVLNIKSFSTGRSK